MIYIIGLISVIIDQVTKYIVSHNMHFHQSIPVIKNVFHITNIRNSGMAFGLFRGANPVLIVISIIVIIFIIVFEKRITAKSVLERVCLGLILGGAVGNLIDRVLRGYITDFFDFRVFPIFNVADSSVFVGAVILFFIYVRKKPARPSPDERQGS